MVVGGGIGYFFPQTLNGELVKTETKTQPVESNKTEVKLVVPPMVKAHTLSSAEASMPPPLPPAPTSHPQEESRWLARAQEQISKQRFTSPVGDNAYETYQALLKITSPQAPMVLEAIVTWYSEQAQKLLSRDRLISPPHGNAYEMYQKMKEIAPHHPNTKALLNEMVKRVLQRATQQLKNNKFAGPEVEKAYNLYQELHLLSPESSETRRLLDKIINGLLQRATQQMTQQKYATPKNDNAADTYQKILQIVPRHRQAQEGINNIVDKYYQSALMHQKRGHPESSLKMIETGLQILPNDTKLLKLKESIAEKKSSP